MEPAIEMNTTVEPNQALSSLLDLFLQDLHVLQMPWALLLYHSTVHFFQNSEWDRTCCNDVKVAMKNYLIIHCFTDLMLTLRQSQARASPNTVYKIQLVSLTIRISVVQTEICIVREINSILYTVLLEYLYFLSIVQTQII